MSEGRPENIFIKGVGTIGLPLALFANIHRKELGIERVFVTKKSTSLPCRVQKMTDEGIVFCAPEDKIAMFEGVGIKVGRTVEGAMEESAVIIDCTVSGEALKAKNEGLFPSLEENTRVFVAQGSEEGFGKPVAFDITDKYLTDGDQYVQVVSCNTHFTASVLWTIGLDMGEKDSANVLQSQFVLNRRDVDFSQNTGAIASPSVGLHDNEKHGTHQAADAANLFRVNLGIDVPVISSVSRLNQEVMHMTHFSITLEEKIDVAEVVRRLNNNRLIGLTNLQEANVIFSQIRDFGAFGRSFNQAIVVESSIAVFKTRFGYMVTGWGFTPQDGNSLMTSIAVIARYLHGKEKYRQVMEKFVRPRYVYQRF